MAITFKNVTKRVGAETHIHETSVAFVENEFNILLGTTLAGKTTFLQLMAGLEVPTTGEIWFGGKNVTGVATQKRNVSMVHQQFINYPHFSVFDNIASPLRVAGVGKADIERRVGRVAELLKLTPMLKRRPNELSGGQQQRTALARALVKDADLVLLDEPLANLDYKLREELRDELPKLLSDRKCTVVYATTEPTEALLLGGYTATIHAGRVTQYGKTPEVYRRPADLLTAQVFSDPPINTTKVTCQAGRMVLNDQVSWAADGPAADLPAGTYLMGVRPHFVTVQPTTPNPVAIRGRVIISELSGSESVIHFNLDGLSWVSQSHGIHGLEIGAEATFYLNTSHCIYFGENQQLMAA